MRRKFNDGAVVAAYLSWIAMIVFVVVIAHQ